MQTNFLQGKSITVSEKLLVRNSRYFADIFGSISEDVDTMVLKRQGGCLPGDEPEEEKEEEPMRNVSYATMRTVVDFFETGVLKVGEQVLRVYDAEIVSTCTCTVHSSHEED